MEMNHSQSQKHIRPFTSKPRSKSNNTKDISQKLKSRPATSFKSISSKKPALPNVPIQHAILRPSSSTSNISSSKVTMDFRTILPSYSYKNQMFNKYWKSTAVEPKGVDQTKLKALLNKNQNNNKYNEQSNLLLIDKMMSGNRILYKYPHINWEKQNPTSFLTHVGGSEFDISQCETNLTSKALNTKPISSNILRPYTALDKKIRTRQSVPSAIQRMLRPTTAAPKHFKNKEMLKSDDEDLVCLIQEGDLFSEDQSCKYYPKVKGLVDNYQGLSVRNFSIKTSQADTDLLEIFDRTQRSQAATLAKVGDYDYYTSCQRIGCFFDFSMHLKWKDLKNIELHIKQSNDNLICCQSKHNIQPTVNLITASNSTHFNDPNSLFHGFMPFESDMSTLGRVNSTYDPIDYLPKYTSDDVYKEQLYSDEFVRNVTTSINNYNKYLDSSKITKSDLHPFNLAMMKKKVIQRIYISVTGRFKKVFDTKMSEVERLYYHTLKTIIMDYILRSPHERKRLNIMFYPRKALPSSYIIARNGSFNRNANTEWVENYANSFNFIDSNLSLCNIAVGALIDWTQSFNHINLFYVKKLSLLKAKDINGLHIDDFYSIEESYLSKIQRFIRDIYYRGCVLITKKNKFIKRKDLSPQGRWTFKGFIPFTNDQDDDQYGMSYEDQLSDFWTNVVLNDLIDVRLTASNYCYVTYILRKQIDLDKSDYDCLSREAKSKLNNSVTAYCTVFLRKLVENGLNQFCNFFESFESNQAIFQRTKNDNLNFSKELEYKDRDLRLPDMLSFKICHLVNPIISIKTKYEATYNIIKLEYNFDQVYSKMLKISEIISNLFNSLCATHILEFKDILPSNREKIAKEHSAKLNDFFNADPNQNKSFLEEYYSSLCPNLILEESNSNQYMKTYLRVINTNDVFVSGIKRRIYSQIKTQFNEMEECLKVFDPIKEYTSYFNESLKAFLETCNSTPDYVRYTEFIDKIRIYQKYVSIIPNTLSYSMFVVDLSNTKTELTSKLNNDMALLMASLEHEIINYYNGNIHKYSELVAMIDIKLTTPEEVVAMEKTKVKVSSELAAITRYFDDSHKIFVFLLKIDHIFSNEIIAKVAEGKMIYYKFKDDQERVENMHKDNREFLENKYRDEKKQIDEDLEQFLSDINLLDNRTHITEYENLVATTDYYLEQIPSLKARIDRNLKDEELLFDYRNGTFEIYELCLSKITKLSVIWKNIQVFYDERRSLIHNFNEEVDVPYYISLFYEMNETVYQNKQNLRKEEDVIARLSKILEDDIESLNDFLKITNDVIQAPYPIDDVLKGTVLKILGSKTMEQSCKDILFTIYSKKAK